MVHIWHEDSSTSSTSKLWNFLILEKFNPCVKFEVTGTNGNGELVKKVASSDYIVGDIYLVFVDVPFNNEKALGVYKDLLSTANGIKNVYIAKIVCFEDLLLKFKLLREWTRPIDTKLAVKYDKVYDIIMEFNADGWQNSIKLREYIQNKYEVSLDKISSEKIAALLLADLTRIGRTKFRVTKTGLGGCWISSCCIMDGSEQYCGIDNKRLNSKEKAKCIHEYTDIHIILEEAIEAFKGRGIYEIEDN